MVPDDAAGALLVPATEDATVDPLLPEAIAAVLSFPVVPESSFTLFVNSGIVR